MSRRPQGRGSGGRARSRCHRGRRPFVPSFPFLFLLPSTPPVTAGRGGRRYCYIFNHVRINRTRIYDTLVPGTSVSLLHKTTPDPKRCAHRKAGASSLAYVATTT